MSQPRLIAAISNISMNLGHTGLALVAKKFDIKIESLQDHELVLYINKGRDKLKLLGAKGVVLGYVKMPGGRKLPMGAIQFIPETFSGKGTINIDAAISKYLTKAMANKGMSTLDIARATRA